MQSTERRDPMASIELEHDERETSVIALADASLMVTVTAETHASPEQVIAAARDFSADRAKIWPNVEANRLEVHEHGHAWAEVTEGTMIVGVFWERCRYDWSEPGTVTATVIESNVFKTGSSWKLETAPRAGGGTVVATTVLRNYRKGIKGTFAKCVNHLGGKRLFGWLLRSALNAIERTYTDVVRTASPHQRRREPPGDPAQPAIRANESRRRNRGTI